MHYLLPQTSSEMFSYEILIQSLWTHLLARSFPVPGSCVCCWQTSHLWHWPPRVIHPSKITEWDLFSLKPTANLKLLSIPNSRWTKSSQVDQRQRLGSYSWKNEGCKHTGLGSGWISGWSGSSRILGSCFSHTFQESPEDVDTGSSTFCLWLNKGCRNRGWQFGQWVKWYNHLYQGSRALREWEPLFPATEESSQYEQDQDLV